MEQGRAAGASRRCVAALLAAAVAAWPAVPVPGQPPISRQGVASSDYDTAEDGAALLRQVLARQSLASLEAAAEGGDGEALYLVGIARMRGIGAPVDLAEARRLFRRSVLAGFHRATFAYGGMLFRGEGGERNVAEALSWWQAGADAGNAPAMVALGDYYRFQAPEAERDATKAKLFYERAAAKNHAGAKALLADYLWFGLGGRSDRTQALAEYEEAARLGSSLALYRIGYAQMTGVATPKDPAKALASYRKAAAAGSWDALHQAARMLVEGAGVPADPRGAGELLLAHAAATDWAAQAMLAKLVLNGAVAPPPGYRAEAAAEEADRHGYPEAIGALIANLREGRNGYARDLRRAAELARPALARARARPIEEEGAWLMHALGSAYTIQVALAANAIDPQPGEAEELARIYGNPGKRMIRMDVPVSCNGVENPFWIYLWDVEGLTPPSDAQFDWVEKSRGCSVPIEERVLYRRLFDRARATRRSYPDVVVEQRRQPGRKLVGPIEF